MVGGGPWGFRCRWTGVSVASRGAAPAAEVGRHRGCPVGRLAGGMGGADVLRPPSPTQGCVGQDASAPTPPPFPGDVWVAATPMIFKAGHILRETLFHQ